jgi:hypothetical protein
VTYCEIEPDLDLDLKELADIVAGDLRDVEPGRLVGYMLTRVAEEPVEDEEEELADNTQWPVEGTEELADTEQFAEVVGQLANSIE